MVLQHAIDFVGEPAATIVWSGPIEVEDRLGEGEPSRARAGGHLTFAEENEAYLGAVRSFLQSVP